MTADKKKKLDLLYEELIEAIVVDSYLLPENKFKSHAGPGMIRKAVDKGFPVDYADKNGRTLLLEAIRPNTTDSLSTLIELGANVNHRDRWGRTAFYKACREEDTEKAKLLLDAGANPNITPYQYTNTVTVLDIVKAAASKKLAENPDNKRYQSKLDLIKQIENHINNRQEQEVESCGMEL
ncbi:MAG: ankyrin repeat domain-containing protein [Synergistaceae bacterium]|nr:ankyrin repeat domain-containing protein [Synergistaceae bacterium]